MVELGLTQLVSGDLVAVFLRLTHILHGNSIETGIQKDGQKADFCSTIRSTLT